MLNLSILQSLSKTVHLSLVLAIVLFLGLFFSDGGYGVGMEVPFAADNYAKVAKSVDKDERIGLNNTFADEAYRTILVAFRDLTE